MMNNKGRIHLVFTAELNEEFLERTEKIKQQFVKENLKRIEQLRGSIK